MPRLFADFFAQEPFGVQKMLLTFWHLFGVFLTSFWRTKKGSLLFAVLFQKKGQQKVAEPILDAKRSLWKKDGKRSWHLHSALEISTKVLLTNCISAWRAFLPGETRRPKHRSTFRFTELFCKFGVEISELLN